MQAVILAAGACSRFWPLNDTHKALIKIAGKPIIQHTIESLERAGVKKVVVIQNPNRDIESILGKKVGNIELKYVIQEKPLGMGNALHKAKEILDEQFFVLNPEQYFAHEIIEEMLKKQIDTGSQLILLGKKTETPWIYGILNLENDRANDLIEKPKPGEEPSNIKVAGIYLLPKEFFEYYNRVERHMYDYEDALRLYMKEKDVRVVFTSKDLPTLKYPWHALEATKLKLSELKDQEIDKSAEIASTAIIEGPVHIGKNTKVMEHAVIKGPVWIGDNCIVGNHALIRDHTNIEGNCVIGAHCEITRSLIQENVHTHSGFIGDSIIGRNCRIGAGIITANVRLDRKTVKAVVKGKKTDTKRKSFGTAIGSNTKIGVHVSIMPGILIGKNCVVGPHTIVKENIEDDTTYYSKFEGVVKKRSK